MEVIIIKYLKILGIKFSPEYIIKYLLSHPNRYSLLSIKHLFENLGLQNSFIKINKCDLDKINFPFLIHFNDEQKKIKIINSKQDLKQTVSLKNWTGIVITAKINSEINFSAEHKFLFKSKLFKKHIVGIIFIVLVINPFLYINISSFSMHYLVLSITSLAGIYLGVVLILKDLGFTYQAINTFCERGIKSSCDHVLRSKEAKIFKYFSLSELVFSYFIAQYICLSTIVLFDIFSSDLLNLLRITSLLTIPVIILTLYIQYYKLKYWCKICLIIDLVLITQLIIIHNY